MIGGVTRLGGLPGLSPLSAGVTICHENLSRWGSPPGRGRVHGEQAMNLHVSRPLECLLRDKWNLMHQSKTGGLHKHAILGPVYMEVGDPR